jgi:hypothetical protein
MLKVPEAWYYTEKISEQELSIEDYQIGPKEVLK